MITNLCLGVTIFTFAIRVKYFDLSLILVGAATYWSIIRGIIASSKNEEDDYSELTQKILGKKIKIFLNILIIICSNDDVFNLDICSFWKIYS